MAGAGGGFSSRDDATRSPIGGPYRTEGEGFEPSIGFPIAVFKTSGVPLADMLGVPESRPAYSSRSSANTRVPAACQIRAKGEQDLRTLWTSVPHWR
jgi:hypothetical protein